MESIPYAGELHRQLYRVLSLRNGSNGNNNGCNACDTIVLPTVWLREEGTAEG